MSFLKYNALNFSYSRYKTLCDCQRKYFFQYYSAQKGWDKNATQREKDAYRLKQLQPLSTTVGTAVHTAITSALTGRLQAPTEDSMYKAIIRDIKRVHLSSCENVAEWYENPKQHDMLLESYYHHDYTCKRQTVMDKVHACTSGYLYSTTKCELDDDAVVIITLDDLLSIDFTEKVRAYLKADIVYRINGPAPKIVVADWKTGTACKDDYEQVLVYAYLARKQFALAGADIEARLEYLANGQCRSYQITNTELSLAEDILIDAIGKLTGFHASKTGDALPEAAYKRNLTSRCSTCNYQELCSNECSYATSA